MGALVEMEVQGWETVERFCVEDKVDKEDLVRTLLGLRVEKEDLEDQVALAVAPLVLEEDFPVLGEDFLVLKEALLVLEEALLVLEVALLVLEDTETVFSILQE